MVYLINRKCRRVPCIDSWFIDINNRHPDFRAHVSNDTTRGSTDVACTDAADLNFKHDWTTSRHRVLQPLLSPRVGLLLALGRAAAASALAPCSVWSSHTAHPSQDARRHTLSPCPSLYLKVSTREGGVFIPWEPSPPGLYPRLHPCSPSC